MLMLIQWLVGGANHKGSESMHGETRVDGVQSAAAPSDATSALAANANAANERAAIDGLTTNKSRERTERGRQRRANRRAARPLSSARPTEGKSLAVRAPPPDARARSARANGGIGSAVSPAHPRAIDAEHPLLLASGSPRRREILGGLGLPLIVRPADVEESRRTGEPALAYLSRVVGDKLAAAAQAQRDAPQPAAGLLVADTIVVLHDRVLGKPVDMEDAARLLGEIAGRTHTVYTRYAIAHAEAPASAAIERTVQTRVTMRAASPVELEAYAKTGEGLDKAGAYAAQGIGAFLVERIEGSYTNVVGLPACEVVMDLMAMGLLGHFP